MKIIKKILKYPCYCCKKSIRGKTVKQENCKACNGTGIFIDEIYYHIYTDKNGKQYAIDGDTRK